MSDLQDDPTGSERTGAIRGPQALVSGLTLLARGAGARWLLRDLPQGTLRSMGPSLLPRWLAFGVGLCGIALVAAAFLRPGHALERWSLRGPLVVVIAIFAFALTIRPFPLGGGISTPGLGLIGAGPLAIFIGGYATPEARFRDLVVLALALTPVCMLLFGDLLNLPIPLFPLATSELFPAGWSQKAMLRVVSVLMLLAAGAILLTGRRRRSDAPIDVADHSLRT
jgi:hypothetical protein